MSDFKTVHVQNTIQCEKIADNGKSTQNLSDELHFIITTCINNPKKVWNYLPFLNEKLNKYQDKPDIHNINFNNFLILTQKLNDEIFLGNEPNFASIIEIFRFLNNILDIKISFFIELSASQFLLIVKLLKLIIHKASLENGFCANVANSLLISKSLKIFASMLKNQQIVEESVQPVAEICVYSLNENLAAKNYKTIILILSQIKHKIHKNDPIIKKLLLAASEIKQIKKFKTRNVSMSSVIIILFVQELLSSNIGPIKFDYLKQISKFILEILDEFFSQLVLASNKKPDEIYQLVLKIADDCIILSQNLKYPAAIYLIMAFKRFATKMFEGSTVSISTKTNFILIISKIVSFYENCVNLSEFNEENLENTIVDETTRVIGAIENLAKQKAEKLKNIFIYRFGFEMNPNLFYENIQKIEKNNHEENQKNISKSLMVLNAVMLIKYKIKSVYGYFSSLLKNHSVPIRMMTLKSINSILKNSPHFFKTAKLYHAVKERVFDRSYLVRRYVIEIFGTLIRLNHSKSHKLLNILYNRCLDSNFPVRKSVMTNLGEIACLKTLSVDPNEVLYKMLQRIEDRKGIRKIIVSSIKKIWKIENDEDIVNIADSVLNVVQKLEEDAQETLSKIFSLIDDSVKPEDPQIFFNGFKRVLDYVFHSFLSVLSTNPEYSVKSSKTLCVFAKILPNYFEDYISIISKVIINLKIDSDISDTIFQNLCQLFAETFPVSKNLEQDEVISVQDKLIKIILQNSSSLGEAILCLKLIIQKHPDNFKLISELFYNYLKFLEMEVSESTISNICRVLYTLSNIIKNFPLKDFFKHELNLNSCIKRTGNLFLRLSKTENSDQKIKAVMCIMNFLHQNPKYFLDMCYKEAIFLFLDEKTEETIKICVVKSFLALLKAEEIRGQSKDEKPENKYTLISNVIQAYFSILQQSYATQSENIRRTIFLITRLSIKLGLLHPQKYILMIITMLLDPLNDIQKQSIHNLKMIKKKFPGVIESNMKAGIWSAYNSYKIIIGENIYEAVQKNKSCFFEEIYAHLTNKVQRRKFIQIFLGYLCAEKSDIDFIAFCSLSLVYLPFRSISDVVYTLNQIEISLGLFDEIEDEEDSNFEILLIPTFKKLVCLKMKNYLLKTYHIHQEQINFESPCTSLIDSNMPEKRGKSSLDYGFLKKFACSNQYQTKRFYLMITKELRRVSKC